VINLDPAQAIQIERMIRRLNLSTRVGNAWWLDPPSILRAASAANKDPPRLPSPKPLRFYPGGGPLTRSLRAPPPRGVFLFQFRDYLREPHEEVISSLDELMIRQATLRLFMRRHHRMAHVGLAAALAPWFDRQAGATYTDGKSALGTCNGSPP
jgi:hypothetical protein